MLLESIFFEQGTFFGIPVLNLSVKVFFSQLNTFNNTFLFEIISWSQNDCSV